MLQTSTSSPLAANKSPQSAMGIVDTYLQPQKAASATVTSDLYDQQMRQLMNSLNKLQSAPAFTQRTMAAAPPAGQQPPSGSY